MVWYKTKNVSVTYVGGYAAADIPTVIKETSARAAARLLMTSLTDISKSRYWTSIFTLN